MAAISSQAGGQVWAFLGDMELDDTLLGLGAAGLFGESAPVAVGFLVNAAHCAELSKEDGSIVASEMYAEKRTFLDTFFNGCFWSVLDRYSTGGKGRGWVGSVDAPKLAELGQATGLEDELGLWAEKVLQAKPAVLHLLLSGPLIGRGVEVCGLLEKVLNPSDADPTTGAENKVFIWCYAGSFNLTHSSPEDLKALRELVEKNAPRVSIVETTLKSGAWICDPPRPFWGSACPTAWSMEQATQNPVSFDISTDIQSVNMFFEEYCSEPKRGLRWIFDEIAKARALVKPEDTSVSDLLSDLEVRSLGTNLTKMVQPDSGSMGKLREALQLDQQALEAAHKKAVGLLDEARAAAAGDKRRGVESATKAAQEYAELYRGAKGDFVEAGSSECFPRDKPFSGPRLDKRCILRCMAKGKLQGGPSADVLILLSLLLFLEQVDAGAGPLDPSAGLGEAEKQMPVEVEVSQQANWCSCTCTDAPTSTVQMVKAAAARQALPERTQMLFRMRPGAASLAQVFVAELREGVEMADATKRDLAPLIDEAMEAVVRGAVKLQANWRAPRWGRAARAPFVPRKP